LFAAEDTNTARTVARNEHLIALAFENSHDRVSHKNVVINDKNLFHEGRFHDPTSTAVLQQPLSRLKAF